MHTNTNVYHSMPLLEESSKGKTYVTASFATAVPNRQFHDTENAFLFNLHRANHYGSFQVFYGVSGSVGHYRVERVSPTSTQGFWRENVNVNDSVINLNAGRKRFSAAGLTAGVNYAAPLRFGEWRVIGVEVDWNKEFGNYIDFRKQLPDSAANWIDREDHLLTVAVSSDLLIRVKKHIFGYKLAVGLNPRIINGFDSGGYPESQTSVYASNTLHYEYGPGTVFVQGVLGTRAASFHAGLSFRLGRN